MSKIGARVIRPVVLCALLLVPAASAETGLVESFRIDGAHDFSGTSTLVGLVGPGALSMQGSGDILWGDHYATQFHSVADVVVQPYCAELILAIAAGDTAYCTDQTAVESGQDIGLFGATLGDDFQVRLFAEPGQMTVAASAQRSQGQQAPQMYAGGGTDYELPETWNPDRDDDLIDAGQAEPKQGESRPVFSARSHVAPSILADTTRDDVWIRVEGDFFLEFAGMPLDVLRPGVRSTYETGWTTSDVVSGQSEVRTREFGLIRLELKDARIEFTASSGVGLVASTSQMSVRSDDAPLTMTGVSHDLIGLGQADGEHLIIPAPYEAALDPTSNGMAATITPQGVATEAPGLSEDTVQALFWAAGALLFVAAVVAIVVRQVRTPGMPVIEAALDGGAYSKAARLATRIIHRDPLQESAQLARAIAWSRMGQHERIVRHIEPFLRRHEPSDGTIHYVLGLAHRELGHQSEARDALAEAVQRTPALLADVAPELNLGEAPGTVGYS